MNSVTYNTGEPKAYLNYILFDASHGNPQFGFMVVPGSAAVRWEKLSISISIPSNGYNGGYAYVYLTNESNYNVFFDDFLIVHEKSNMALRVTESADYYPFGLLIEGTRYVDEGRLANAYGYQGDYSEFDSRTGWNRFALRGNYDSRLGRWQSGDPYQQFASPYVGMGNNAINGADPDGGFFPGFFLFEYLLDSWLMSMPGTLSPVTVKASRLPSEGGGGSSGGSMGPLVSIGIGLINAVAPEVFVNAPAGDLGRHSMPNLNPQQNHAPPGPSGTIEPPVVNQDGVAQRINVDQSTRYSDLISHSSYDNAVDGGAGSACARYIRYNLEVGLGLQANSLEGLSPKAAREYGPYLVSLGFQRVINTSTTDMSVYRNGDIVVMNGYPGGTYDPETKIPYGHVQIRVGNEWQSSWKQQRTFWPGAGYERYQPRYQVYRYVRPR